jgi:hypothetical protein
MEPEDHYRVHKSPPLVRVLNQKQKVTIISNKKIQQYGPYHFVLLIFLKILSARKKYPPLRFSLRRISPPPRNMLHTPKEFANHSLGIIVQ